MSDETARMERSYRNTVYCSSVLDLDDGKLTGRYCGNRWCLVCNRVRTGLAINRYLPVVLGWPDAHTVTLTAPNVPAARLKREIRRYLDDFTAVKRSMNRTHKVKLVALRKLECTCNVRRVDYHPHFHVVVTNRRAAKLLVRLWLEIRPDASPDAQHCTKATPGSLRELFKYFTKLVTKARKTTDTGERAGARVSVVDAAHLDVIFTAMRGFRVWQSVGFTLPKSTDDETATIGEQGHTRAPDALRNRAGDWPEHARFQWSQQSTDWSNSDGEALTGYNASWRMKDLVTDLPDVELLTIPKKWKPSTARNAKSRSAR